MFSIFNYLRQLVRDSVLAGVQDAFEIMDHGNHRDTIAAAAQEFLVRSAANQPAAPLESPRPGQRAPETQRTPATPPTQLPSSPPTDLVPSSFHVPPPELPKIDGYDNYERRKKTTGKHPKQHHPRSS